MARIENGNLALEVCISGYGWVWYYRHSVCFLWKDRSLLTQDVFGEDGSVWANGWLLTEVIERVLETGSSDTWEAMEPEVRIAFYPGQLFPFTNASDEPEGTQSDIGVRTSREKSPDDIFTILAMVDAFVLEGYGSFWKQGPSFIISCRRWQLERFCQDLQAEYAKSYAEYEQSGSQMW